MLDEFQKSIKAILYDRITSPLSGTFLFTWLVWNWKIIYLLIKSDEKLTLLNKIHYIELNYCSPFRLIVFPLASTLFLIFIYPYFSNYTYSVWLKFKEKQNEIRNKIENNQLLTLEKSQGLRIEIENAKKELAGLFEIKENELKLLKMQIKTLYEENKSLKDDSNKSNLNQIRKPMEISLSKLPPKEILNNGFNRAKMIERKLHENSEKYEKEFNSVFANDEELFKYFKIMIANMKQSNVYREGIEIPHDFIELCVEIGIVIASKNESNAYLLTEKGKYFVSILDKMFKDGRQY